MLLCRGRTAISCFLTWDCPPNPSCVGRKAQPRWPEAAGVRAHGSGAAAGVRMACASKGHRGVRVPNLCELCPDPWLSGTGAEGGEEVTLAMGTGALCLGSSPSLDLPRLGSRGRKFFRFEGSKEERGVAEGSEGGHLRSKTPESGRAPKPKYKPRANAPAWGAPCRCRAHTWGRRKEQRRPGAKTRKQQPEAETSASTHFREDDRTV